MDLHYLVYISYASPSLKEESLTDLLHRARLYNRLNDLTGTLLMYNKRFIQVLEGSEDKVRALYERIKNDKRHHGAVVVSEGPLEKRNFKKWAMAYEKISEDGEGSHYETNSSGEQVLKAFLGSEAANSHHPSLTILRMFQKKNMAEVLGLVDGSL